MADNPKNKREEGDIPVSVLNQLNEFTAGGFILFYFNSKTGFPEKVMTFDTPVHSIALQKHISDWSEALHKMNVQAEMDNFSSEVEPDSKEDEDEE